MKLVSHISRFFTNQLNTYCRVPMNMKKLYWQLPTKFGIQFICQPKKMATARITVSVVLLFNRIEEGDAKVAPWLFLGL